MSLQMMDKAGVGGGIAFVDDGKGLVQVVKQSLYNYDRSGVGDGKVLEDGQVQFMWWDSLFVDDGQVWCR